MKFCGASKKRREKPLIPASYMGQFRCAIPESGDELTMYPLGIANWQNYPVSILKHAEGHYILRGEVVAVEAVLRDQRPLTGQIRRKFYWGKVWNSIRRKVTGRPA